MNIIDLFEDEDKKELTLVDAFRDFLPIAINHLHLKSLPKIIFLSEPLHDHVPTFGKFENEKQTISLVVANRQPADIIRTFAHELVHYRQGTEHELSTGSWQAGSPTENEANAEAGIMMRLFDSKFSHYLELDPIIIPD